MYRRLLLGLFAVLFITALLVHLAPRVRADVDKTTKMLGGGPEQVTLTPEEQQFVDLVNKERKAHHLSELKVAPLLVKVAREKSQEMHDLNYWGHVSPITEKRTAMRRVLYYLPEPPLTMTVGENLCLSNQVTVGDDHQALMDSPTHRKNILKPEYQYIGVGSYISTEKRFWTTEIFLTIQY